MYSPACLLACPHACLPVCLYACMPAPCSQRCMYALIGNTYEYVGCFSDNADGVRDLPIATAPLTTSDSQTALDNCASQCAGYQYIGLQWTSQCFCGNSYGSQGTAECPDDCGLQDSGTGCGGRNAVHRAISGALSANFPPSLPPPSMPAKLRGA